MTAGLLLFAAASLCTANAVSQALPAGSLPAATLPMPWAVTELSVGVPTTDSIILPGTLTLPVAPGSANATSGPGQKPAPRPALAVLVQGSGIEDRSATIGPNKLFDQLAQGLAARGVAVLRYEPRARVAPEKFLEHADLDHDVVIDAAAALEFASTLAAVDERRLFLVGHALGAQLAPDAVALRLVELPGSVRGVAAAFRRGAAHRPGHPGRTAGHRP